MNDVDPIYRELQQHLDRQAVGYPATKSGAELRILERLFSPGQAKLALHLGYKPAAVEAITASARVGGIPPEDVEGMLDAMADNGVIGRDERDGQRRFHTIPFVVGMFEGQLRRLTPEFLDDVAQYTSDRAYGLSLIGTSVPQMRTIPVGRSISAEHHVATFDDITEIIRSAPGPFAILGCICREMAAMRGRSCAVTSRTETCMAIGVTARNAVRSAGARTISREEALEIARLSEADGLVFQPSNTREVGFICACCGCCCGMLRMQRMLPRPVDFWAANYRAQVRPDSCTGCGACVASCQVDALALDGGTARVDAGRCIGCGNCVAACAAGAISLRKKEPEVVPPQDSEALYDAIMEGKKDTAARVRRLVRGMVRRQ